MTGERAVQRVLFFGYLLDIRGETSVRGARV